MKALPFARQSFDLIWAEGAIYIIGFDQGLRQWQQYLKPQGYIAVTELSWIHSKPPKVIQDYWQKNYPAMKHPQQNLKIAQAAGLSVVEHFNLGEECWWDDYYQPMAKRIALLRDKYAQDAEKQSLLDICQLEIDHYQQYSNYYSYVFYLFQKP